MKNGTRVVLSIFLLFFLCLLGAGSSDDGGGSGSSSSKWYAGGTLHRATIGDWKNATFENKLATAADMALSNQNVKNILQNSS